MYANKQDHIQQILNLIKQKMLQTGDKFTVGLYKFREHMYYDFLGGPHVLPIRVLTNLFKGATGIYVYLLMCYFNNFSLGIILYALLHGSYGFCWITKDIFYPDPAFKKKATIGSLLVGTMLLTMYWVIPVTIAAGYGVQNPSIFRMITMVVLYLGGLFLMMGSDYQKAYMLARQKGLISNGFFARTRNPNYLGEMMIYGSFAICTGCWLSYAIVIFVWVTLFNINIYLKDETSYKHKKGWSDYQHNSYLILPKLFTETVDDIIYVLLLGLIAYIYMNLPTI